MPDKIIIRGARVHNLKNVNLEIPHNKLVVFTGLSGSGKSSLAFDTIFAEGQRRYIESLSPYARQFLGQMKPADVDEIVGLAPSIAIDQKALSHNPRSTVGTLTEIYDYLRVLYARVGEVFCPQCGRKIKKLALDEMVDIVNDKMKELAIRAATILAPVVIDRKGEYYQLLYDYLALGYGEARIDGEVHSLHEQIKLARYKKHNIDIVIDKVMPDDLSRLAEAIEASLQHSNGLVVVVLGDGQDQQEMLLSANWTCPYDNFAFPEVEPRLFSFNSPHGACPQCSGLGRLESWEKKKIAVKDGEVGEVANRYERVTKPCLACAGQRLRPETLAIKILDKNIAQISALAIDKLYDFFEDYRKKISKRNQEIAGDIIQEVSDRLFFLLQVGLNYLSLDREAETLSGGEAQRIRLSSQIGSHLSHTLYILDEPTIGLHERDNEKLIDTLKSLRDQNNSVIIVEHDERVIRESDYLVDLGPLAGRQGGEVVAQGEVNKLLSKNSPADSLTLDYLRGKKEINFPHRRMKDSEMIKIIGARANNLKNIQVEIPLRKLVCVTGVSGSGKSTLLYDVLYRNLVKIKSGHRQELENVSKIVGSEYINRAVVVDQSPIGRSPRSNPATYTGIFMPIREFFAQLPQSRERAYTLSRFSFNRAGGRCEACAGAGFNLIEMHFLPPVYVECEVCHGRRFNRETLQVKYKNKNIAEVLELTIDEALNYFDGQYQITDKLKVLEEVGLGYLQLGQSATTLSGGEAQRIKLARELTHTLGKKTLYLLDEPTVGLHYYDIQLLLEVLNKLIERGNSIAIIEHNMHIIKSADWLIDLGPDGGAGGGRVIAKGLPEEVARDEKSITGQYLKKYL
ncbi:MAG TPA: excinuclease ABC subunit UvrA [bacterium]|nr:excinuclease ABC subunit UvrA [bacterium]HNW09212.1 excinuclease ABC subunit UvrA [bacterium]HNZ73747.1 excinuclease ABC subunit UvrA [bacterium]HOH67446.1 excinuclease ABC subunit UvrA [bacterium]HPN81178.1 excinuclease ABC subunit UvrA [bacterium]